MLKQVDIAIFNTIQELVETGEISEKNQVLGIKENGVSISTYSCTRTYCRRAKSLRKTTTRYRKWFHYNNTIEIR